VHLSGAFDAEWLAKMRAAFDEAMEKPGKHAEFMGKDTTWDNMFDSDRASRLANLQMFQDQVFFQDALARVPAWGDVATSSPAAGHIARLMQSKTAAFFYLHLIVKRGGADKPIPWHQDLPYWKLNGSQVASVWVPLDDMPAAASVQYIKGSHKWGLFQPRHFVDASPYEGRDLPALPDIDALIASGEVKEADVVRFDVKAGDAVCFDSRIVHGSPGNPEAKDRDHRRVAFRFGGDDATYFSHEGETAIPTPEIDAVHGLRHGDPIACEVFPQVWPMRPLAGKARL